jgi:hypothetical protein
VPFTIIGVMPANFRYLSQRPALWMPMVFTDDNRKPTDRHSNNMEMIARLAPDATIAAAAAQGIERNRHLPSRSWSTERS